MSIYIYIYIYIYMFNYILFLNYHLFEPNLPINIPHGLSLQYNRLRVPSCRNTNIPANYFVYIKCGTNLPQEGHQNPRDQGQATGRHLHSCTCDINVLLSLSILLFFYLSDAYSCVYVYIYYNYVLIVYIYSIYKHIIGAAVYIYIIDLQPCLRFVCILSRRQDSKSYYLNVLFTICEDRAKFRDAHLMLCVPDGHL